MRWTAPLSGVLVLVLAGLLRARRGAVVHAFRSGRSPWSGILASVTLAGCASLFGIDDLKPLAGAAGAGARAPGAGHGSGGADGEAGSSGAGGSVGDRGGTTGGVLGDGAQAGTGSGRGGTGAQRGSGGARAQGGSSGGGALDGSGGSSAAPGGASSGGASSGKAGDAGDAGDAGIAGAGGEGTRVQGRVIDVWGHALSGVSVAIGDDETTTNKTGAFAFTDVPATYDASLIVHWPAPGGGVYGWFYQGLTRRDPTLQVYRGLKDRAVELDLSQQNGAFDGQSQWLIGFGSPNATSFDYGYAPGKQSTPNWQGPATNDWTIHSLLLEQVNYLPAAYAAYDSTEQSVTDGEVAHLITVNLDTGGAGSLASDVVSGSVTTAVTTDRSNYAVVRFASGATIPVVDGVTPTDASFNYLVPTLPDASITLAASAGNTYNTGYALVHADGLTPGTTNIALDIPAPPTLTQPDDGADVDWSTDFSFLPGQPGTGAYVVQIADQSEFRGIYLVTSKTHFSLSELAVVRGKFTLTPSEPHGWAVETHGTPASVDEMCGPAGFIDEFAKGATESLYPVRNGGSFTQAAGRGFTTPPP